MNTSQKVAYNTIAQIIGKVIVSLIAIITLRISTNYLGVDTYGSLTTIMAFLVLFSALTDFGLTTISAREASRSNANEEEIMGNNLAIRILLSVATIPIVVGAGWLVYSTRYTDIAVGIAIFSFSMVFSTIQTAALTIFTSKVRNDVIAMVDVISKVLMLIGILLVVKGDYGLYGYMAAMLIAGAITAFVSILLANRIIRLKLKSDLKVWKSLVYMAAPLGAVQIINVLYFKVDSVMLSIIRTPGEVGYYGVAYRVIELVMSIPVFFMTALLPAMTNANKEQLERIVQKANDSLLSIGALVFTIIAFLAKDIIIFVSSAEFSAAAGALIILMIGATASYINAVYGNALVAINQQSKLVKLSAAILMVNVLVNYFLIPKYGIYGAAAATSFTEVLALIYVYYLFRKVSGIKTSYTKLVGIIISTLITSAVLYSVNMTFYGPTVIKLIVAGFLASAAYACSLLLTKVITKSDISKFAKLNRA